MATISWNVTTQPRTSIMKTLKTKFLDYIMGTNKWKLFRGVLFRSSKKKKKRRRKDEEDEEGQREEDIHKVQNR